MSAAWRMAEVKSAGRDEQRAPSMASITRARSGSSSPMRGGEPAEVTKNASSESDGNWRANAWARARARPNSVPPPLSLCMLAESSTTITAACASKVTTGRSVACSEKGRAKMKGRLAAAAVRASMSRISRSLRRDCTRRSEAQKQLHGREADGQRAPLAHPVNEIGQGRSKNAEQKGRRQESH
jgi:hypothetical protein